MTATTLFRSAASNVRAFVQRGRAAGSTFMRAIHITLPGGRRVAPVESQPPRREMHLLYGPDAGDHVQWHFTGEEAARLGLDHRTHGLSVNAPAAAGSRRHKRATVGPQQPNEEGLAIHVGDVTTNRQEEHVKEAMGKYKDVPFHARNVHAPNCVGAAGEVVGAVLGIPNPAPQGAYCSGAELAEKVRQAYEAKGGVPPQPVPVKEVVA